MSVRKIKAKRILSLLLALIIISAVPLSGISVFAETSGNFEYRVLEDGTAEITEYTGSAASLAIPSEIDGYKVTGIGEQAFWGCVFLKQAKIPNSVINIGGAAFYGCTSLKNIIIPNSVTSIGPVAFENCTSLTSFTIPQGVTNIEYETFSGCTSLKYVSIPNSVIKIGSYAFESCTSLTDVTIPSSVTSIGSFAFHICSSLENITVDSENPAFSDIDGVLFNKNQTEIIRYPSKKQGINYSIPYGVTSIADSALSECTFLTDITIPSSITNIGEMAFTGCTSLTDVTLPNSVTNIDDWAFFDCTSLTDIDISDSITSIGIFAFGNCKALSSVTIPESCIDIDACAFGYTGTPATETEAIPGFRIYGYNRTAAEAYAKENGFEFIALNKAADKSTGISVYEKEENILPDGAELKVKKLSAEENEIVFDISLVKDGKTVQPKGAVTVKIPVPQGMNGNLLKVYREEANGSFTDMSACFANGYMVFTTDHFSKYILSAHEPSCVLKGDVNGDGAVDAADAVLAERYNAGMADLSDKQLKAADVNSDGVIDAADAVMIMRYDAGLIDSL